MSFLFWFVFFLTDTQSALQQRAWAWKCETNKTAIRFLIEILYFHWIKTYSHKDFFFLTLAPVSSILATCAVLVFMTYWFNWLQCFNNFFFQYFYANEDIKQRKTLTRKQMLETFSAGLLLTLLHHALFKILELLGLNLFIINLIFFCCLPNIFLMEHCFPKHEKPTFRGR